MRVAARPRAGGAGLIAVALARSSGGVAALTAVYERHHQALYRYCRAMLRNDHDAQDALQSTMTRAFAALQDERRDFELRPWLFRIAHNEAVSMLRKRRPTEELDELSAIAAPVEDQVALNADVETLRGDLESLPQRQRAALLLRELNGLSHEEIGQALECRPDLVKQTIYQARAGLMQAREGREMECGDVRRTLSDGDGRVLRGIRFQAHLRSCAGCRAFRDDLVRRPAELALLAPPLPVAAGAALLERLLPGAGAGAGAAGAMAALLPKAVTTLAVVAATATGATTVARHHDRPHPRPAAAQSAPAEKPPARAAASPAFTGAVRSGRAAKVSTGAAPSPGKSAAAKSRGRSEEAKSRGRSDEAKARGRSDEAKTKGAGAAATSRGRSDEAKTRGRSDEAKSRGRNDEVKSQGNSAAAKTRSRSTEAKTRSRSTEAKTRSRSASAKGQPHAATVKSAADGAAARGHSAPAAVEDAPAAPHGAARGH